jgi:hypothetical protein
MRRLAATLTVLTTIAGCSATESKPEWLSQAPSDARQAPIAARACSETSDDDLPPPPDSAKWLLPGGPVRPSAQQATGEDRKAKQSPEPAGPVFDLMADPKPPAPDASLVLTGRNAPAAAKSRPQLEPTVQVGMVELETVPTAKSEAVPAPGKSVFAPAWTDRVVPAPSTPQDRDAAQPMLHTINSKRIRLNYEVKEVGRSGIGGVELWYTRDGRTWQKYPGVSQSSPCAVDVDDENLYGFTLVARSGAGVGKQPPQPGDTPQVWVEVDVTKPVVRLLGVEAGSSSKSGTVSILWSATDKNLHAAPITLCYATQSSGPWVPIASHLANTGRYVWKLPAEIPNRFFVRVEAIDRAGNIGAAQTPSAVLGDLSQPSVEIINVSAARE